LQSLISGLWLAAGVLFAGLGSMPLQLLAACRGKANAEAIVSIIRMSAANRNTKILRLIVSTSLPLLDDPVARER
jgi:hypothetical protein